MRTNDDGTRRETPAGFVQFRDRPGCRWRYQVTGFHPTQPLCSVLRADGSEADCPVDATDRVKIAGRWVARTGWDH